MMKLKSVYKRFRLGKKPKKDGYKQVIRIKKETIMIKFEGQEPEKGELIIPILQTTFLKPTQMIRSDNKVLKITYLNINALKCEDKEQIEEVKVKMKVEMLL